MTQSTIETKREKLEQQKARLLRKAQKLKVAERKAHTKGLINLGQLAADAGLENLSKNAIKGAFLEIQKKLKDPDQIKIWEELGENSSIEIENPRVPIAITFPSPPNKEIQFVLKQHRIRWNNFRKEWQGYANPENLRDLLGANKHNLIEL